MKFVVTVIQTFSLKQYVTGLMQILVQSTDFADFKIIFRLISTTDLTRVHEILKRYFDRSNMLQG